MSCEVLVKHNIFCAVARVCENVVIIGQNVASG